MTDIPKQFFEGEKPQSLLAAEARADQLIEQSSLNEALLIIDGLEAEVSDMNIAQRFSRTKESYSAVGGPPVDLNPLLRGLNEADHKREQLLRDLRTLKAKVGMKPYTPYRVYGNG
jgi:hypothetical protein